MLMQCSNVILSLHWILCTLFFIVCSCYNITDLGYSYSSVSDQAEGRQLKDLQDTSLKPTQAYSRVPSTSGPIKSGIIKTGMDIEDSQLYRYVTDKPLHYKYNYPISYRSMEYGNGYYEPHPHHGLAHSMHEGNIDGKESLLKGFGVGLAVGLGVLGILGAVSSLLKSPMMPLLALGALLPIFLLLPIPIPVITTGKMLASHSTKRMDHLDLQGAIDELIKKISKLDMIPIKISK